MNVQLPTSRRIVCSSSRYTRTPHRLSWDLHPARGQQHRAPAPGLRGSCLRHYAPAQDISYRVWTPVKCCQYMTHTCTLVKLFIISCLHLLTIFHCALLSTRTVYWCASFVPTVQLQPARHRAPLPFQTRPRPAADISKLFPHSLIFANQKICHLFNYSNKRELESLG